MDFYSIHKLKDGWMVLVREKRHQNKGSMGTIVKNGLTHAEATALVKGLEAGTKNDQNA